MKPKKLWFDSFCINAKTTEINSLAKKIWSRTYELVPWRLVLHKKARVQNIS